MGQKLRTCKCTCFISNLPRSFLSLNEMCVNCMYIHTKILIHVYIYIKCRIVSYHYWVVLQLSARFCHVLHLVMKCYNFRGASLGQDEVWRPITLRQKNKATGARRSGFLQVCHRNVDTLTPEEKKPSFVVVFPIVVEISCLNLTVVF